MASRPALKWTSGRGVRHPWTLDPTWRNSAVCLSASVAGKENSLPTPCLGRCRKPNACATAIGTLIITYDSSGSNPVLNGESTGTRVYNGSVHFAFNPVSQLTTTVTGDGCFWGGEDTTRNRWPSAPTSKLGRNDSVRVLKRGIGVPISKVE